MVLFQQQGHGETRCANKKVKTKLKVPYLATCTAVTDTATSMARYWTI